MVTNWTSQAWTDANQDYWERNIVTVYDAAADEAIAELKRLNEWRSNAPTRPWPTVNDVGQWRTATGLGSEVANPDALQWALDSAIDEIAEHCTLLVRPVDADGVVDPGGAPVEVPPRVFLATILHASFTYELRNTPTGVAGSDLQGGVYRVGMYAPAVDRMLRNYRRVGLA